MTDQIILTIPDEISARAREIAETTEIPVEQVLIQHLKTLSAPLPALQPDQQAEIDALHYLSDDALWTIAREELPQDVQSHAHRLMTRNSQGTLTDDEAMELHALVERADRLMLRKAEAAAILKERGTPLKAI
jgi:hypothetical protein